jgi:hypothetical protein
MFPRHFQQVTVQTLFITGITCFCLLAFGVIFNAVESTPTALAKFSGTIREGCRNLSKNKYDKPYCSAGEFTTGDSCDRFTIEGQDR